MTVPFHHQVKHSIKVAIAHVLYALGILQAWQRHVMRRRAVVLMYHRVLTDEEWRRTGSHPGMSVTTATFDRHMALLRRRFKTLALDAFADHVLQKRPFPSSSCLITFDDGWRDTMTNAVPVMRRHELPATVFLPVNFVGARRLFVRESFAHLIMSAHQRVREQPARTARIRTLLESAGLDWLLDLSGPQLRSRVIVALGDAPVDATMTKLVADMGHELGVSIADLDTPDTFVTWAEVQAMTREGITFGGHGADHLQLALAKPDQVESEVRQARDALESQVGPAVKAFAYPNGSCNPAVADALRAHGYQLAFTTRAGLVGCDDDPFLLRRVNMQEAATSSTPMFLAKLVGLF